MESLESPPPSAIAPEKTLSLFAEIGDGAAFRAFADFARRTAESATFSFDSAGITISVGGEDLTATAEFPARCAARFFAADARTVSINTQELFAAVFGAVGKAAVVFAQKVSAPGELAVRVLSAKAAGGSTLECADAVPVDVEPALAAVA